MRVRIPVLAAAVALLAAGAPVAASGDGPVPLALEVLSTRADLVSGGDALVEVRVPAGADAASVRVTAGDRDVSDAFAVRDDGRVLGRVEGLPVGTSTLTASAPGAVAARLDVTNHPLGGPVFTGRQVQPWVCTTAANGLGPAQDAQCSAPTVVTYHYKRVGRTGFAAYDPQDPPSDVATTTTDSGVEVPFIVRQEKGTMNRGIYTLAVLYDPTRPFEPWDRQDGWNGKLFYPFGASCGTVHSQGSAQNVLNEDALRRGFMVATSSLNVLGSSCNTHVSAESMMMLKEHVVERYGTIRFTFGNGSSGGAIGQQMVANNYPGLLQGLTVGAAYADNGSTGTEVFDCHVLVNYFTRTSPHLWGNPAQQALVAGHGTSPATCAGWEVLFSGTADPTSGCGSGVPAYHPTSNPTGCRGTYQDFNESIIGKRDPSVWTQPEKAYGGFAKALYDNVGVQYGLEALRKGLITTEQFVDLNEKVGGFDVDFALTRSRSVGDAGFAETLYKTGTVNDARQLDQVAIIDSRTLGNVDPLLIHTMHHSFALKERLRKVHGTAENHVVWRGPAPASSFDTMDAWLTAVEADRSGASLAEKIRKNRPEVARDSCRVGGRDYVEKGFCDAVYPYYGAPRIAAGGPVTHDNVSCQLTPLDRSADYGPVPFTDDQWARLLAAFPGGVCDWTKPPQQLVPSVPWATYAEGPGGQPLGAAPQSRPLGG